MGKATNYIKTLHKFMNEFAPAFVNNNVPEGQEFPYITYNIDMEDYFQDGVLQITIYTNSNFFVEVAGLVDAITEKLGHGYKLEMEGGGYIYLKPNGSNFELFVDEDNKNHKNAYLVYDKQIFN